MSEPTTMRFSKRLDDGTFVKVCWHCANREHILTPNGNKMYAPNCKCDERAGGDSIDE